MRKRETRRCLSSSTRDSRTILKRYRDIYTCIFPPAMTLSGKQPRRKRRSKHREYNRSRRFRLRQRGQWTQGLTNATNTIRSPIYKTSKRIAISASCRALYSSQPFWLDRTRNQQISSYLTLTDQSSERRQEMRMLDKSKE